jgi:choline dehydrogenase
MVNNFVQSHELGASDYHGDSGLLPVTRGRSQNPLHDAFIKAAVEAGYPATDDFNAGTKQEGFGRYDFSIGNGQRARFMVYC